MKTFLTFLLAIAIIYWGYTFLGMALWSIQYGVIGSLYIYKETPYELFRTINILALVIIPIMSLLVFQLGRIWPLRYKLGAIWATWHFFSMLSVSCLLFNTQHTFLSEPAMVPAFLEPHVFLAASLLNNLFAKVLGLTNDVFYLIFLLLFGSAWFFYLPILVGWLSDKRKNLYATSCKEGSS